MTAKNIIGISIIAALLLGGLFVNDYFQQSAATADLSAQVLSENQAWAAVTNKTRETNAEIASSTANLTQLLKALDAESNSIPDEIINSNEIVRSILQLGEKNEASVVPLNTNDWSNVQIEGNDFRVFKMAVEVHGSPENVVRLIGQLPELFNTLIIENVSLRKFSETPKPGVATPSIAKPTSGAANVPEVTPAPIIQMKANLALAIYTR